jgi:hypothetical protein
VRFLNKEIRQRWQAGNIEPAELIEVLVGLDAAYSFGGEHDKKKAIGQAIGLALQVMSELGAQELSAEIGQKFDPQIHCGVGTQDLELPEQTICDLVSRGFRIGERVYPAQVIVVRKNQTLEARVCRTSRETQVSGALEQRQASSTLEQTQVSSGGITGIGQPNKTVCIASYDEYRQSVRNALMATKELYHVSKWLTTYWEQVMTVYSLNFDPIATSLEKLYAPTRHGSEPKDPTAILRSLQLMVMFQETSITRWAVRVQTEPLLAIFSGFRPGDAPCVGSYYHLLERLENGPYYPKCRHRILPSERRRARNHLRMLRKKPKGEENNRRESPEEGVIARLVKELKAKENEPVLNDLEKRLNEILLKVAVMPSAQKGLLQDIKNLTLAGDGSTLPSCANSYGQVLCDCRNQGIFSCEHIRKFSDMDAAWGWDNQEKDFVFGYRYYQLVCGQSHHDLPMYLTIAPANAHEAVMSLKVLDRFARQNKSLAPAMRIDRLALDAIHDCQDYYRYLCDHKIRYAIPYAHPPAKCVALGEAGQLFTHNGVPVCPGGLPMRLHGHDRQGRLLYNCPVKRPSHREGKSVYLTYDQQCPLEQLCEPHSSLGPFVHVSPAEDPRIHPAIPRDSKEFKVLLASRTCCERSNSAKKYAYQMKITKTRVMPYAFIRLALISLIEHSKAWLAEKFRNFVPTYDNILRLFG